MKSDNAEAQAFDSTAGISRRRVMGGVGAALAGGLVTGVAGAPSAQASDGSQVASGPPGTTVFEFVCNIVQDGKDFSGVGYLTDVAGLDRNTLFSDNSQRDEAHAFFVAKADGQLVARSGDGAVHALDIEGKLNVYYSGTAGASWSDPQSFQRGSRIAQYSLDLQDVLTVIMPLTGIPTLNGESKQLRAGSVRGRQFGAGGLALRFMATGLGTRSDTGRVEDAQATLTIAGSMVAV